MAIYLHKGVDNASYHAFKPAIITGAVVSCVVMGIGFLLVTYKGIQRKTWSEKLGSMWQDTKSAVLPFGAGSAVVIGGLMGLKKWLGPK